MPVWPVLLVGCDGLWLDTYWRSEKYLLLAVDARGQMSLSFDLGNVTAVGLVGPTVAAQCPPVSRTEKAAWQHRTSWSVALPPATPMAPMIVMPSKITRPPAAGKSRPRCATRRLFSQG